jgi:hypothetical protein
LNEELRGHLDYELGMATFAADKLGEFIDRAEDEPVERTMLQIGSKPDISTLYQEILPEITRLVSDANSTG